MAEVTLNQEDLHCRKHGCLIWHMRKLATKRGHNPDDRTWIRQLAGATKTSEFRIRSLFKCSLVAVPEETLDAVLTMMEVTPNEFQEMALAWERFRRRKADTSRQECCRSYE